jgi:hypothetical protein
MEGLAVGHAISALLGLPRADFDASEHLPAFLPTGWAAGSEHKRTAAIAASSQLWAEKQSPRRSRNYAFATWQVTDFKGWR